jgi:hypothetical protein
MRSLRVVVAILTLILAVASHPRAQTKKPDFSGMWTTTSSDKAQTNATKIKIAQTTSEIAVTEDELPLVYKLDGSKTTKVVGAEPSPNSPGGRPSYVTSASWKGSALVLTTESSNGDVGFSNVDTYALAGNGQRLTRIRIATVSMAPDKPTSTRTEYVKGK